MKIMIDGMNLALDQGTGVATYARNLASCVRRLGFGLTTLYGKPAPLRGDPVLREAMLVDDAPQRRSAARWTADLARSLAPVAPTAVPETGHVLREQRRLQFPPCDATWNWPHLFHTANARFLTTGRLLEVVAPEPVDVAHWTYPVPIRVRGAKNVYTFHDLVPLKLPYATLDRKKRYWRLVSTLARQADHLVTVSECSRRDIVDMLRVPPEKVTNTHQSVAIPRRLLGVAEADVAVELAHAFHAPLAEAAAGELARLEPRGFYLFLGAIEPKKNLRRLLEAYLASGVPEPLVVVGRRGWSYEEEVKMMERSPRVLYLDYLPFGQVITLLRSARALLWPSLYEGFGLPILEAFLCGSPVVTAKGSATEEIAGGAALLVDPYDPREIRDAIRRLSAEGGDALRAELVEKGRARAEDFDEARIAPRVEAVYRRVLAG